MNRFNNNKLDPAYLAMTQNDEVSQLTMSRINDSQWEKIRVECIRRMRLKDEYSSKARSLYRVINRKDPKDLFSDVDSIASDCHSSGMPTSDMVACMLDMID